MPPQPPQPTREQFIESLFLLKGEDNIYSEKKAITNLISGVRKGFDSIKPSYGSAGSNVIIEEQLYPYHRATNDGKDILDAIKLVDPVEMIGLNAQKEVADKSDKESGDGRKTAAIMFGAILFEGQKAKEHPMEIKRSLDECLPLITESIDAQTTQITPDEVGKIAAIASENPELGAMFQEIYQQIGKDGIIELDNSGLPHSFYDIIEGVRLRRCGFQYPYMANVDKEREAVYRFPKILITKQKLSNMQDLSRIMRGLYEKGTNELVIFCDEIDTTVSQALSYKHFGVQPDGKPDVPFKTLVIKAPTLWKDWLFEDFAKITGATIINPAEGTSLKNFNLAWLGTCDKLIATKDETIVLGTQDITAHLQVLADLGTDEAKIRASRLQTKTAILKLGANSETELAYLKKKALDARNASFLALNGGVVVGGGFALLNAAKSLPNTVGGKILKEALKYPSDIIQENMGETYTEAQLLKQGVLDPSIVVKNSITNALSVAATRLTARLVIIKPKQ